MTLLYLIPALYRPAGMERVLTKKALGIEDRVILGSPEDDMQAAYYKASMASSFQ